MQAAGAQCRHIMSCSQSVATMYITGSSSGCSCRHNLLALHSACGHELQPVGGDHVHHRIQQRL